MSEPEDEPNIHQSHIRPGERAEQTMAYEQPLDDTGQANDQPALMRRLEEHESSFNMKRRHMRVIFLDERPPQEMTIVGGPGSTFNDIKEELSTRGVGRWTILQATYLPIPFWTDPSPDDCIGIQCQTLYAIREDLGPTFDLAVVRNWERDYPIIFSNSYPTIPEAVIAADPQLAKVRPESIGHTQYSVPEKSITQGQRPSKFPQIFIITVGKLQTEFSPEISPEKVPPFLQLLFLQCKRILQQSYDLETFSLQMIHLSRALLHVVISLANDFGKFKLKFEALVDGGELDTDSRAFLQAAPLHAETLKEPASSPCSPRLSTGLRKVLDGENNDPARISEVIDGTFEQLCGEYPGGAVIRRSHSRFKELKRRDEEARYQVHNWADATDSNVTEDASAPASAHPGHAMLLVPSTSAEGSIAVEITHNPQVKETSERAQRGEHLSTLDTMLNLNRSAHLDGASGLPPSPPLAGPMANPQEQKNGESSGGDAENPTRPSFSFSIKPNDRATVNSPHRRLPYLPNPNSTLRESEQVIEGSWEQTTSHFKEQAIFRHRPAPRRDFMSLLELPNELLLLIADHLPMTGVSGLRRTCRRIYKVLKKLNRKRIVMDDVMSLVDLENAMLSPWSRNRLRCATALEISAITILPPLPPRTRLTLSSFLSTIAPNTVYFSLYLVSECDISYIPPHPPGSHIHPCLTHLSIVNFRVPPSFLTSLPFLVKATIVLLVTPIQNEVGQLQYRPSEVQTLLLALHPTPLKRLTITCTSLPPDILAMAAQRFTSLTHLSFAWLDAPDRLSSGVDSTDITGSLHQYANAITPLAGTLQALYLPACVGIQSAGKGPIKALSPDDELLGEGPVLVPLLDQTHGWPVMPIQQSSPGWNGIHQPKPGRVSVGMKGLLNACKTLVRDCGNGREGKGDRMYLLEKIGWLIPQGDDLPLLPIECIRRRGVVTFGGFTKDNTKPRKARSVSNASMVLSSLTSLSLSSTYSPNTHVPRSVPITYDGTVQYGTGFGALSKGIKYSSNDWVNVHTSSRTHREESEYWYPSMDWREGCAWPAFTEIDGVFPRPEFLRY